MTAAQSSYLICYDISESQRRLARIRRRLIGIAAPIQYSVFVGTFTGAERRDALAMLAANIDARRDDVRLYPIPRDPLIVTFGRPVLPDGIFRRLPLQARSRDEMP